LAARICLEGEGIGSLHAAHRQLRQQKCTPISRYSRGKIIRADTSLPLMICAAGVHREIRLTRYLTGAHLICLADYG
jgi:hypothetical protein